MKEDKKNLKKCEECKELFEANRKWQRFCSPRCRFDNWDKNNPRSKKAVKNHG